jgi:erythronate-4-phosphate dehydrogenase
MNHRIKVVADANIPFLSGVLEPYADIQYYSAAEIHRENIKGRNALLIRTPTKCDAQLLDGSDIKFIGTATIGYDHIDTDFCKARGIKWTHAPGCNASSVTQYFVSAILTIAQRKKIELSKMTIGIIGVGNVGRKAARLAQSLGMKVLLNDPPRMRAEGTEGFVDLGKLIGASDIISFHVPLIKEGIDKTYHMADAAFFATLNHKIILLNTSRGLVIETQALKNAIKNRIVDACVLDVWENEPEIDLELLKLVDIATPHIAGYSAEGKASGTAACIREISSFFKFGIDKNWYPQGIPSPDYSREIVLDSRDKTNQELISEAVLVTYPIDRDDQHLRNSVGTFEKQRVNYPVRREFPFFRVTLLYGEEAARQTLSHIGFSNIRIKYPTK